MFDDGVLVSLFYKQSDIYKEDQKNKFKPWTRYGFWINHKNCIELIIKKRFFEWIYDEELQLIIKLPILIVSKEILQLDK